jgi:hypothetical protein
MAYLRLLGAQAAHVLQIVNALASTNCLQIRLRGIGSGFKEGPFQVEHNEPLHFVVSADDEIILKRAMVKVNDLVERVRGSSRP